MKKLCSILLCLLLLCSGCAQSGTRQIQDDETLQILATTYPIYLFTTAVTEGAEGVQVTQLITQEISCLHDYTLTVTDMKVIEQADVIVLNGAGLEDFMDDALAQSDAPVIDCSEEIELLPAQEHEGHRHDTEYDPHYWMDPQRAAAIVQAIAEHLSELDPERSSLYHLNAAAALDLIGGLAQDIDAAESLVLSVTGASRLSDLCSCTELITFHDGFQYFAQAFGLDLLKAIEEEEGAETSAAEIREITALIQEHNIPAIFTEKNGSDATAQAIARETGCRVYSLDLIMSGTGSGIQPYLDAVKGNLATILDALGGE